MLRAGHTARRLGTAALLLLASLPTVAARADGAAPRQSELERLKARFERQAADIEEHFAELRRPSKTPPAWYAQTAPPIAPVPLPPGDELRRYEPALPRRAHDWLPKWQAELSRRFALAAETASEILKLNPPDADRWRETYDTLALYAQPVSPPETRSVFGAREVSKRARVTETPAAEPTEEARAAKVKGDVRLRLVLASDGTVRHVFPIKSLGHGLTERAVEAARRIRFEPAERGGQPVSQFATYVYEFRGDKPAKPYVPPTIF